MGKVLHTDHISLYCIYYITFSIQHSIEQICKVFVILIGSRAILTYLVGRYGQDKSLYPEDPITRAKVDSLLYFDQGTLVPRWRAIVVGVTDIV